VHNPTNVLYGRLPGFGLTPRGHATAAAAAEVLRQHDIRRLVASPLQRAVESAQPIADATGLPIETSDRLLEATSRLEGGPYQMNLSIFTKPPAWPYLVNPLRPSWGEPYREVAARVLEELKHAWNSVDDGDVALVSHQLPIWMAHRIATGKTLAHLPTKRRCSLSSITQLRFAGEKLVEVGYVVPAPTLADEAKDVGAV
jgi:broad specificity phosphatase PhoE